MRTLWCFKKNHVKIGLILVAVTLGSCNTLRRVDDNELLLTKNEIHADGEKVVNEDLNSLLIQKPNSAVLGYNLRLNLYNLAKVDPDSSYQAWLHKTDKREDRLVSLLSRKQVDRLGESFMVKGYSEWLKSIGEPPVIIDTTKTRRSLERISAYYGSKGYFNNTTRYEIDSSNRAKRAGIDYRITLGKPYMIDSLTKRIDSRAIDSIYNLHKSFSYIQQDRQFDLDDFNSERKRLTTLFRNSGVHNFQESSITYDIVRDTMRLADDQEMDVELNIDNLRKRGDSVLTTSEYKVHRFNKVNIYADYTFGDNLDSLKSVDYEDYTIYYKEKLRYKPKALTDAVFLKKDSVYRDIDRLRTYRQITNLNTFKYPNIEFIEDSTQTKLASNIYLAPRSKYSLGLDFDVTHSNIQRIGIGFSTSMITRNVFGGAETLSISAGGTFGLLSDDNLIDDFFSEIGGDINLSFPRIWFPFISTKRIIPYYMLPRTRVSAGTSFQKNIGLDKQTFNTIYGYNWTPSDFLRHTLELLNIQFIRNVNPQNFFNVYGSSYNRLDDIADAYQNIEELAPNFEESGDPDDPSRLNIPEGTTGFTNAILNRDVSSGPLVFRDVSRIEERRVRLTENNLIFTTNYSFTKNNRNGLSDNNFYQFRLKVESAGNLLAGIANIIPFNKNDNRDLLVFGVPFSQYLKTEFDYIKHWTVNRSDVLAFRTFLGVAVPYGNSTSIPFTRSYFAGGSNDNRAWNPYSLGPGSTQNNNDFNEANLKIALNLEYRFPIVGNIKGALFADAGNIWNIWDSEEDPAAIFSGIGSLADIALGTGMGLRYDFTYFVFRLDFGFKTYNPAEEPARRWFSDYNFANGELQIGINYPF